MGSDEIGWVITEVIENVKVDISPNAAQPVGLMSTTPDVVSMLNYLILLLSTILQKF